MFSEDDSSVTVPSALIPEVQQQLLALPPFESVKNWVKDLSALKNFTFMDLYTYLIESKDKEFDHKSLRTFIGLFILQRLTILSGHEVLITQYRKIKKQVRKKVNNVMIIATACYICRIPHGTR